MPRILSQLEEWITSFWPDKIRSDNPMSLDGMIFGMPPSTNVSDNIMYNSMPIATIIPCEPRFDKGTSLFTLDPGKGWKKYIKILNSVDFTLDGGTKKAIKVAYMADNFPTDSFNNEYGETIFDRMAQGVSSSVGDFSQILGITNTKDLKTMAGTVPVFGDAIKGTMNYGEDKFKDIINNLKKTGHTKASKLASEMGSSLAAAATGARIDFPMVWKNSSFTPSYTMTIRLYNPNPADPKSTKKYIVGPIAAILSMALPKVGGKKVASYKWPLFCKILSPGIYNLNAGFINSVSIIKGGEQQSIAYNQSLTMCDIRIEFGSLYNSMIAGKGSERYNDKRPTLANYLEVLGGKSFQSIAQQKELFNQDSSKINLFSINKLISQKTDKERGYEIPNRIKSDDKASARLLKSASTIDENG